MQEDFYQILGISRNASKDEIKKAYRKLARKLHPDRNSNNKSAEEQFKKVSAAYAVLSDSKKKQLYDQYGVDGLRDGFNPEMWKQYGSGSGGFGNVHSGGTPGGFDFGGFGGFGPMEDIFESLFGNRRNKSGFGGGGWQPQKGANIKSRLDIEMMDIVLGRELKIVIPIEGEQKNLTLKIPRGIEDGQTIRLKEQGAKSPNGGPPGDLLLEIRTLKTREYERKGNDLTKREKITIGEAYFGAVKVVDTPWGKVNVNIPKGTQGGSKLRLKGKGIKKGKIEGDLFIEVLIEIPTRRDKETDDAIQRLEQAYGRN